MGCDIHIYREKFIDGQWVTADTWKPCSYDSSELTTDEIGGERNYAVFYCLAGVRQNGDGHPFRFAPRGMPLTASAEVLREYAAWHVDGHSHSFLYLHELEELLSVLEKNVVTVTGVKDRSELARFRAAIAANKPGCWDLLYPYCAWTNSDKFEEFCIEVPASYQVKDQLCRIIEGLKEAGGERQRIVFWFDD